MGIRLDHVHEGGKRCYIVRGRNRLKHEGIFQIVGSAEFAAAYMPYTGHWYAWDPKTGKETATFDREFFERHIAPWRTSDLVADPDCVPSVS